MNDEDDVIAGDMVMLNANTRPAFAHQVLHVTEVRHWGLVGYITTAEGRAYYRAEWSQVGDVIPPAVHQPLRGM